MLCEVILILWRKRLREEIETPWKSVSETKSLKKWQNIALNLVGIGLSLLMILFLFGCTKTEYIMVEPKREPITCHEQIKTYLDIAKCLEEYKIHWKD